MSARQPIPVTHHVDPAEQQAADAIRLHVETLTGQDKNAEKLTELPAGATLDDLRQALNILIRRLGG